MNDFLVWGFVALVIIGLFILGPVLSIMAVNHLFGTAIAVNFWNWLATAWLHVVVASSYSK